MDKVNVEQLLSTQKIAFDEVIYYLTEPGVPPGQRVGRFSQVKTKVDSLLSKLVALKKTLTDPADHSKIDSFVNECVNLYQTKVAELLSYTDTTQEYGSEMLGEGVKANTIPSGVGDPSKAKKILTGNTPKAKPKEEIPFTAATAEDVINTQKAMTLNISLGIDYEDGETIPDTHTGDIYYVLKPLTETGKIKVVRFINAGTVTQYVYTNFTPDLQPSIFVGREAKLKFSVNLEV